MDDWQISNKCSAMTNHCSQSSWPSLNFSFPTAVYTPSLSSKLQWIGGKIACSLLQKCWQNEDFFCKLQWVWQTCTESNKKKQSYETFLSITITIIIWLVANCTHARVPIMPSCNKDLCTRASCPNTLIVTKLVTKMHARNGSGICWASHLYRFHWRHNHHCFILSYY